MTEQLVLPLHSRQVAAELELGEAQARGRADATRTKEATRRLVRLQARLKELALEARVADGPVN